MSVLQDEQKLRGLNTVRVEKTKLIEVVTKNREDHRAIFEEALEGWKTEAVKQLERAVEDAKAGREFEQRVRLPRPQDHTKDYDQVLRLLDMSLDDELELTAHDFQMFVMDEWGWQGAFLANASNYGSEAAMRKSG